MRKLAFRKQSSGNVPSNGKKRKLFSLFCGTHGARSEDTLGGEQEAIPPAQPCQISHRGIAIRQKGVLTREEEEDGSQLQLESSPPFPIEYCPQSIVSEPRPGRDSEITERCHCRHGSQPQNLTFPPSKHVRCCVGCGRCQQCASRSIWGSPPRCETCRSRSPLLELPTELHMEMIRYLDFPASWLLRLSSKYFYEIVPAPIGPWDKTDMTTLLSGLRMSVPDHLKCCDQCLKYHSSSPNLQYTWIQPSRVEVQFCLRHLERTAILPVAPDLYLETAHYICRHCRYVRNNSHCRSCRKCEVCARIKFRGYGTDCIECDAGCVRCRKLRLQLRACRGCGICERCSGRPFQSGATHCRKCGGSPVGNNPPTRKALVEGWPRYGMYDYNPQGCSPSRRRWIGIR
jgi:hypothetical protein